MITMKELEAPVRQWVPDWLGLISIFVVILPVTMLNGSYTGSMLEVSNTLGTNSEDITMGYYAASAGMAIAYPIIPKVLAAFSVKSLLLIDLVLQFFLSWVCARTQNADILIVCSFAVGFLKGFLMLWFIRYAQKIFSPKNVRSEFYSYFYPLVYGGGQASMLVTALLAYHYNWKYMYYFMMVLILISILFVIICFRHNRPIKVVAWSDLHIREMFVISAGLLMLMYVINYGKVLDWMASGKICAYIIIAPMLIALFIWYQSRSENTYSLYIYLLPGYVVGAFICFWWFRWQRWRFRFLIAGGMSCFVIFFAILYFGISPDSTYEMLYLPIFFRGLGMLTLIIAFALFAVEDLNPKYLLSNAFFLIIFRSVLAPILATSFYSNVLYRLQQKYMYSLSETITTADPLSATRYNQSLNNAITQGHPYNEAVQLATNSLYNTLQQQSLLLALKEILGYLLVISVVIAVVSRFIPFHKTIRVTFKRTGDDMV